MSTNNTHRRRGRAGFTLVELLVVIMLIGIMASFVLVALAGATATAKEDRTRAQVAKIHELIMEHWEQYQYRRIPPTRALQLVMQQAPTVVAVPGQPTKKVRAMSSKAMAQQRLNALRELMRMEMPTFISDVVTPAKWMVGSTGSGSYMPAKWRAYQQRVLLLQEQGLEWTSQFQQAECLYLILSQMRDADASALSFFSENEIGDLDGDGMKEIHDAWGNPIRWMLWAPGYVSPLQVPLVQKLEQHDLFDLSEVGSGYEAGNFADANVNVSLEGGGKQVNFAQLPRALYPLIYSSGADGTSGVIVSTEQKQSGVVDQNWAAVNNDPYNRDKDFLMYLIGATSAVNAEAGADDISNHYLTVTR